VSNTPPFAILSKLEPSMGFGVDLLEGHAYYPKFRHTKGYFGVDERKCKVPKNLLTLDRTPSNTFQACKIVMGCCHLAAVYPYQACNVFTYCDRQSGCIDGSNQPVSHKVCRLGFQGALTSIDQQPQTFGAASSPTVDSGTAALLPLLI
jgi:hypothetical protein